MSKKTTAFILALLLALGALSGCASKEEPAAPADTPAAAAAPESTAPESGAPESDEPVVLTVAGGWTDCRALDMTAAAFTELYPNCTINYEYLQDYTPSLVKRMGGDAPVDLFFSMNIQEGSELLPYALDLNSRGDLDLSGTFDGLIENFTFREGGAIGDKLYCVPVGAELRGLYVNMTLLGSLGLEMPTDQQSLLECCRVLKEAGLTPFQGNPANFAQTLVYPWICGIITDSADPAAAHERVNAREPGLSEMFREPVSFLYSLVENYYYDYKAVQTDLGLYLDTTDEAYARDFLNIRAEGDGFVKTDDLGQVAFMPSTMSLQSVMDKTKEDYHSGIEYAFILSPVGPDGGYAYMSPSHGLGVNSASSNLDWAVKFLDFLMQPENNRAFAESFNIIPNTQDALSYISSQFDVPENHICHLGQVTFDYGFYDLVNPTIVDVSKANNPKYMQDDGSGNLSIYPLEYFMDELETSFQQ